MFGIEIHPMHYLFVAAGFFSFHLLLAYLVDHVGVHPSFLISGLISVFLVTSYLSAALGRRFPWRIAAAGQLFYLILFSYSFFLKGMTGLTVAIGSVVTLAVLMKVTAHLNWNEVFSRRLAPKTVPVAPQPSTPHG
jgi:inner membrane protein involved in colicin E2 resistance